MGFDKNHAETVPITPTDGHIIWFFIVGLLAE
jgi:hypothetical protein